MKNNYAQGSTYESFIGRAFNDSSRSKPGTHGTTFTNLVDSENGESNVKHLGSTKKIMDNLKKYMHKAMDKFLVNKKLPESSRLAIEALKNQIDTSNYSDDLFEIIDKTIDLTQVLNN